MTDHIKLPGAEEHIEHKGLSDTDENLDHKELPRTDEHFDHKGLPETEEHFDHKGLPETEEHFDQKELPRLSELPQKISEVASKLVLTLIEKNLHISLAESCTGGLATAAIVSVPGSSNILDASVVTYANHAKTRYAEVPEETLSTYGAVSEQTAGAMARGIASQNDADLGIGISGIAGPGGGTDEKPVGTVCFGIYLRTREELITSTQHFGDVGRDNVRALSVYYALSEALKRIE